MLSTIFIAETIPPMSLSFVNPDSIPIKDLFELTSTDFQPESFKQLCENIGRFDAKNSDDDLWNFDFQSDYPLKVSLYQQLTGGKDGTGKLNRKTLGVTCALLTLCWWETWDRKSHKTNESFEKERAEFDDHFESYYRKAIDALGEPLLKRTDTKSDGNQYCIWRGKNGLLILQQSALDLQFGYDINFWVQPWVGRDPKPPESYAFIKWLQDQTAVPPLFELPKGWVACGPGFEVELQKELRFNLLHRLRGVKAHSAARAEGTDDVLFQLYDFKAPLADVHLTWSTEYSKHWPSHGLYASWEAWREAIIKDQASFDDDDDD